MIRGWNGRCHRCGKEAGSYTMSYFNTQLICDDCEIKEQSHPLYARAKEVELAAVQRGDYNFPGIGKPVDL